MFNQIPPKKLLLTAGIIFGSIAVLAVMVFGYLALFGAPNRQAGGLGQFVNPPASTNGGIAIEGYGIARLKGEEFIKSELGFKIAFKLIGGKEIQPGAYQISPSMTAWQVAKIIKAGPNMKWVTIPEGLRKEQIAGILAGQLGWSDEDQQKWVTTYTAINLDYIEGVYFPDTYLIPINEKPIDVAARLRRNFEEQFAPYSQEALKQNIQWTTVLKLASIIQREAAGNDDMPLISGILWNRLNQGMKLEVDATVQYAYDSAQHYGKEPGQYQDLNYTIAGDWWKPVKTVNEQINSPFNTYLYKGLPPRPIDNPGISAIKAVLYPAATECLYYLHDSNRQIHCAKTYEKHLQNIDQYLKN